MTNSRKTPFIFIGSLPYSGSTLLAFLLASHPQIATIGEMTGLIGSEDPDEYRCSCGEKIMTCDFWQEVTQAMSTRDIKFDVAHFDTKYELGTHPYIRHLRTGSFRNNRVEALRDFAFRLWPGQTRQLREIGARNQALVESVLEVTGKPVFLDSSKYHMRIKQQLQYTSLDIKVIHLVRDARGVVNSLLNYSSKLTPQAAAQLWLNGNHNIERQLQVLPEDKSLRVRYEDLCQDLTYTLEQLHRFCGVEPEPITDDFRSVPHHIVGNKMRLRASSEIKLDERWRKELSEDKLLEIDQIAGDMQRFYGYM